MMNNTTNYYLKKKLFNGKKTKAHTNVYHTGTLYIVAVHYRQLLIKNQNGRRPVYSGHLSIVVTFAASLECPL